MAFALFAAGSASADVVNFSTFVQSSDLNAALGQDNTIGFNYAGNEFVGSVYFGANNLQLYSTNLSGGNVQKFGDPLSVAGSTFSGEVVVAASLGQAGFAQGNIFSGAGSTIYQFANSGGTPTVFGAVGGGETVRQLMFDPGNSFGGNLLVTTTAGNIYSFDSSGHSTLVASIGTDTEGMDIATAAWGAFAGDLLVGSEGTGLLHLVSPGGSVTTLTLPTIPEAETVSFVPLNLDPTNPLQGFYVANYPNNIQFAPASDFTSLAGDAIVTSKESNNSEIWDVHYNGTSFSVTQVGTLSGQSEDGIFVSAQRIIDVTAPEPSTLLMFAGALALLPAFRRRSPAPRVTPENRN